MQEKRIPLLERFLEWQVEFKPIVNSALIVNLSDLFVRDCSPQEGRFFFGMSFLGIISFFIVNFIV